jgi:hypothetical protein
MLASRASLFAVACLIAGVLALVAPWAPIVTAQDLELRDLDLTNWDCLTKLEGSARTQDGKERNRQKNRSPADLAGMKIASLDTAGFLARVADYDRKITAKHRRELNPAQKQQLETFEKDIVSLTGWLVLAYQGIPETTNCKSEQFLDWHLELLAEPADHAPQIGDPTPIICEITPRTERLLYRDNVRIQNLAAFVRLLDNTSKPTGGKAHKIRVTGCLMWDDEHNGTADVGSTIQWVGANKYHHPWRSTAWEIHPVMKVEVVDSRSVSSEIDASTRTSSEVVSPTPVRKLTTPEASKESAKMYPDLEKADSALYKELWARYHRYKDSKPHFFDDPEWPVALAKECADDLGIPPKK